MRDPLGRQSSYASDPAGQRTVATDPSGRTSTVSRDGAGQMTAVDYSDPATPDVTLVVYDLNGRRKSTVQARPGGPAETATWTYDSLGRLTSSVDPLGGTTTYGYDLAGNATAIDYPGAGTVTRGYDAAGRFTSTTDWLGQTSTFGYDADGNPTTTDFGATGQTDTVTYDRTGQPAATTMTVGAPLAASTLAGLGYGRDPTGQLVAETRTGLVGPGTTGFGYDPADRVVTRDGQATWAYDSADNLTRRSDATGQRFDAANQLCWAGAAPDPAASCAADIPVTATRYGYDAQGNRTSSSHPAG